MQSGVATHDATRRFEVDTRPLRVAGAAMLATAAVLPVASGSSPVLCPLRAITGVPCPFCGMTRGVVDVVHGDVGGALLLNPGAIVLVVAAVLLVLGVVRRRISFARWLPFVVVGALWSFQLFKYVTGRPL